MKFIMAIKYKVTLAEEERVMLSDIVNKGKRRQITRLHSQILLNIDQNKEEKATDVVIAKILNISVDTIERTRKIFVEEGLEASINRKKQINRKARKLDGVKEANLIKIACSKAPDGASRWTLQLIADKLVELNIVDSIAKETVRQSLKKMNLSHGLKSSGVWHQRKMPTL
jgi:transposase